MTGKHRKEPTQAEISAMTEKELREKYISLLKDKIEEMEDFPPKSGDLKDGE